MLMGGWLSSHSLLVQAIISIVNAFLALALTVTTIVYAIEARRSRVAAQESAKAAQENLALLKEQYEAQIGFGPQRVREALLSTKLLIAHYSLQIQPAKFDPNAIPNPDILTKDLVGVQDHARFISSELSLLLVQVIANLRKAAGEFEKISKGVVYSAGGPGPYLETASALINAAAAKLDETQNK
jgi:hypothetical protein